MTMPATIAAPDLDLSCINTIRTLSMDAVQAANSGHPGTPMAMAPVAYTLWQRFLRFDPADPIWPNRDRFGLSAGHASTLLYSLLHLSGVKSVNADYESLGEPAVRLEDLRRFRQLDSKTPGHPEYRWTSGVEATTGPLGTGIATSVGMAVAGLWQAATFNRPGYELFDYDVYAIAGDGCLMEGIGAEAASLAGHLKLSNLCWFYDNNKITIEGSTSLAFSEDVPTRFAGLGWAVQHVKDANDLDGLGAAIEAFKAEKSRPTLIVVDSVIGYGAPHKQGTHAAHGEPLGADEVAATKRFYHWPENETFLVPDRVREHFAGAMAENGGRRRREWEELFARYSAEHPDLADQLNRMQRRTLPDGWDADLPEFPPDPKGIASRDSGGKVLNAVAGRVPWMIGGASELGASDKSPLNFYQAGFLIFSDFQRGALRLSALMELPLIHIYTHDSIGVGEDGPTHQPIEQIASIRAMPGVIDMRPGDANEVVEAWRGVMPIRPEPG